MTLIDTNKKKTLTEKEIETSLKFILPGEIARHALTEGAKSLAAYQATS